MKRITYVLLVLLFVGGCAGDAGELTTFILIRHAEKRKRWNGRPRPHRTRYIQSRATVRDVEEHTHRCDLRHEL